MIEQAREAVNALRMLEDCKKNHTACNDCPQYYFGGKIACHPIEYVYGRLADLIESLAAELEQVTRERDAAVEALSGLKQCKHCIGYEEFLKPDGNIERCNECEERSHWQWRGVKEE